MLENWLMELLIGTGKMFLNPVFYTLFLLAAYLGVSRVKRERQNFTVRVENAYFELRQLLPAGVVGGLVLSLIIFAVGIVIPFEVVVFTSLISLLLIFSVRVRLLSPAYTLGFAIIALLIVDLYNVSIPVINKSQFNEMVYPAAVVLLGLLIIAEGIMILANGKKATSPKLISGKRGHTVGVHELKRVWMLPVFLLIPGDVVKVPLDFWPVLSIGGETYSLLLMPFAVGIHQIVQGMLPKYAVKLKGRSVVVLGVLVAVCASAAYFLPVAAFGALGLAIVGRAVITLSQYVRERNLPFYFSKKNHGLMILGVLLNSPASKMELKVGEVITKVNGQPIHTQTGFYEALQRNRAHCKLDVLDANGEVRFVSRALYVGDHHELGILFVQDEKKRGSKAVYSSSQGTSADLNL